MRRYTRQFNELKNFEERLSAKGIIIDRYRITLLNDIFKSLKQYNLIQYIVDFAMFVGAASEAEALEKIIYPHNGSPILINNGAAFAGTGLVSGFIGDGVAANVDTQIVPATHFNANNYAIVIFTHNSTNSGTFFSNSIDGFLYAGFGAFYYLYIDNASSGAFDYGSNQTSMSIMVRKPNTVNSFYKRLYSSGTSTGNNITAPFLKAPRHSGLTKTFLLAATDADNNLSSFAPQNNTVKSYLIFKNLPQSVTNFVIASALQNSFAAYLTKYSAV